MNLKAYTDWQPPKHWLRVQTIDAHTEGEPLRVILNGFPKLAGSSILERRRDARDHHDAIRKALMWEPRGHADMYGCLVTPAVTPGADFGVLFTHNEGYSTMCGHGIIAVTKVMLDTGMLPVETPETRVRIDTPAGLVTAFARIEKGAVVSVYFDNVPSFVLMSDQQVNVPNIGMVRFDIAFGGAFYAFVKAADLGLEMTTDNYQSLIEAGMAIKHAVMQAVDIVHPFEPDLGFLYGTIFTGPGMTSGTDSRNVCIFAEGEVDRCPTGTGVSARMALHYARGDIGLQEPMIIESIIGSRFTAQAWAETGFGPYQAVVPRVEGRAFITGKHEFLIDPEDSLKQGFILR